MHIPPIAPTPDSRACFALGMLSTRQPVIHSQLLRCPPMSFPVQLLAPFVNFQRTRIYLQVQTTLQTLEHLRKCGKR